MVAPAQAQQSVVAPVAVAPSPGALRLAYSAARVIGFCVADRSSVAARHAIEQDYASAQYRTALAALIQQPLDSCMPRGHVAYNPVQLGGGIAEYFLASHLSRGTLADELRGQGESAPAKSPDATQRLAACLIRTAPQQVVALLKAIPESAEDDHAMKAIVPNAAACAGEVHSPHPSAAGLRAILALTSYHIVTRTGASAAVAAGNR